MTSIESRTRQRLAKATRRLSALPDGRFFLVVLFPLLAIYLATASWTAVKSPDPMTNAIAAWKLGTNGGVILEEHRGLQEYSGGPTWIIDADGDPVSQYPPGAALLAAPLYAIWPGDLEVWEADDPRRWDDAPVAVLVPPLAPAALIAAVSTALAVALASLTARPIVGSLPALGGSYIYGLATGAWAVAADTLWQHGPDMLWLALGVWLASKDRQWLGGVAFGIAVLTRPLTAIVAASVGIYVGWKRRSVGPVLRIGAGATAGLVAVLLYNAAVFGSSSISGGYGDGFTSAATDADALAYLRNVAGGLFDPTRGLLTLSPFIALLVIGAIRLRRNLPPAVLGGAIGGTLYLLVQWKANRFSGGSNFVGYRYPLEALAAAAPALMVAWRWIVQSRLTQLIFGYATIYSLSLYTFFTV